MKACCHGYCESMCIPTFGMKIVPDCPYREETYFVEGSFYRTMFVSRLLLLLFVFTECIMHVSAYKLYRNININNMYVYIMFACFYDTDLMRQLEQVTR